MSLGGTGTSTSYRTAVQNCVNKGIVVVVAAGNSKVDVYGKDGRFGTSDDYIPASYPEVMTISALADSDGQPGGLGGSTSYGADDSWATFSNYSKSVTSGNPVTSAGKAIDLILPGVNILSCYKDANYATMSGTSMASPHVAGLVALLLSFRPDLAGKPDQIEALITQSAVPRTKDNEDCGGLSGMTIPNNTYGWGRIDAYSTLLNAFKRFYIPLVINQP